MRFNRIYNRYRKLRGKKPFSLSAWAKAKVKGAVNHVHRYEESLAEMARKFKCQGMICGHIHVASDRMIEEVHYLNSGDWVESHTCIVETMDGEMSLLTYNTFLKNLRAEQAVHNLNISTAQKRRDKLLAQTSHLEAAA
jgi:UDP-2,3-diacylglucosamine pyrophosphatase LpxH